MPEPNDSCPCGSGRKFKRCHGDSAQQSRRPSPRPAASAAGAPDVGFDPFARIFKDDGSLDVDYAGKRIAGLVDLLRKDPTFFEFRMEQDALAERLTGDAGKGVREAEGEDAFELALREFSTAHLHELVAADTQAQFQRALLRVAGDATRTRRDRAAAAIGASLLSGLPDATGLRGRALQDLVLRVTLEELHALEELRRKGRDTEGGLTVEQLEQFWTEYPALRWQHERRYRREVTRTLEQIQAGNVPAAVSADLAMRGAHALLVEVDRHRGTEADGPVTAQKVLRGPFEQDMLDGGREAVIERWRVAGAIDPGGTADDRREFQRTLATALRLVEDGGPGADAILFFAYMRSVVQGNYYVRDVEEADSAREMFTSSGLSPRGAEKFAAYLERIDDREALRRVAVAAVELWPDDAAIRSLGERVGSADQAAAREQRQGPTYLDLAVSEQDRSE